MRLITFGTGQLSGVAAGKLSPQLFLLLTYLRLEGFTLRARLAELMWPHLGGEFTSKGERRDLNNLSVALATLRRHTGLSLETLESLPCDAVDFELAVAHGRLEEAISLSQAGSFLQGFEDKSRLNLGTDIYNWLFSKREHYTRQTREVLILLAEQSALEHNFAKTQSYAMKAYQLNETLEPALLSRLYRLFLLSGSDLVSQVRGAFESYLSQLLTDEAISLENLNLFLLLALQDVPNLAAAQASANLSPKQAARGLENLIQVKLIGANYQVLAQDMAEHYLEQHPSERMTLLSALATHTPVEQAYSIFSQLYKTSQTFGGMGYWSRARAAYCSRAREHIEAEAFHLAEQILTELQMAEHVNQQQPETESRFLHAYALERLRRFGQGLEVLSGVAETPEILSIKSALLIHETHQEAKKAALQVLTSASGSHNYAWARAIALNTLGQIAYEENNLHEAEIHFDAAAIQWQLVGLSSRELGALLNRANVLAALGKTTEAQKLYQQVIDKSEKKPLLRARALFNMSYLYEDEQNWLHVIELCKRAQELMMNANLRSQDALLEAQILNNLAYGQWQTSETIAAQDHFQAAMEVALEAGEKLIYAVALGNLAAMIGDIGKLETSLRLLEDIGNQREVAAYQEFYRSLLKVRSLEAINDHDSKAMVFYLSKLKEHYQKTDQAKFSSEIEALLSLGLSAESASDLRERIDGLL